MKIGGTPCFIDNDGNYHNLERVKFTDKSIAEAHLQADLNASPELLPVDEIDSSLGPLISLGREIDNIDNLYISPNGRITIVETKLWRNPESAREVIAQILDYAIKVSSWSYEELEKNAKQAIKPAPLQGKSLYELVRSKFPDSVLSESEFIDEVQKTLRTGRFMLLIVGDGIRDKIETMVDHLHKYPQMLFTFGLVELKIYEHPNGNGKLIVPQVIANSKEIIRSVVRVHTTGSGTTDVKVELEDQNETTTKNKRRKTLSEDEFFEKIVTPSTKELFRNLMNYCESIGAVLDWQSASISIKLPDPNGSKQHITLFIMDTLEEIYPGWTKQQLTKLERSPDMGVRYVKSLCNIFDDIRPKEKDADCLNRSLRADEVSEHYDDFTTVVSNFVDELKDLKE